MGRRVGLACSVGCLALNLSLVACSPGSSSTPTASDSSTRGGKSHAATSVSESPLASGWPVLTGRRSCGEKEFTSSEVPGFIFAWKPINQCTLVTAGPFGVRLIRSGKRLQLAAPLKAVAEASAIDVANDGTVWVGGRSAAGGSQIVELLPSGARHAWRIPGTFLVGLAVRGSGALVITGPADGRGDTLLQSVGRGGVRALASIPVDDCRSGLSLRGMICTRTRPGRLVTVRIDAHGRVASSDGPRLAHPNNSGDAAVNGATFALVLNQLAPGGVAVGADLYLSADAGTTWRREVIPNLTYGGPIAVASDGTLYVAGTTKAQVNVLLRSSDGRHWSRLEDYQPGSDSIRMASVPGGLWVIDDHRFTFLHTD